MQIDLWKKKKKKCNIANYDLAFKFQESLETLKQNVFKILVIIYKLVTYNLYSVCTVSVICICNLYLILYLLSNKVNYVFFYRKL